MPDDKVTDIRSRVGTRAKPVGSAMRKRQLQSRLQEQLDQAGAELIATRGANAQLRGYLGAILKTQGPVTLSYELLCTECTDIQLQVTGRPGWIEVSLAPEAALTLTAPPDETGPT